MDQTGFEKIAAEHWERQTKLDAQDAMASKLDNVATILIIISVVFMIAMLAVRSFKSEGAAVKPQRANLNSHAKDFRFAQVGKN